MSLVDFARAELDRAKLFSKESDYEGMIGSAVMNMIEQFAAEGHSGFSANMAISIFEKLARFEPLSALTGEPDEWTEVYKGTFQNKRCARVFKEADGLAYDSNGRVFREPDGSCFSNKDSRVYVTFPYTPTTEYIDRPASAD